MTEGSCPKIIEPFPGIYMIKVSLPGSPLKHVNSYLVKGDNRSLLIDTGMNMSKSKEDLLSSLRNLEIDVKNLDIFVTHLHADHVGLISVFSEAGRIYMGTKEGKMVTALMNNPQHLEPLRETLLKNGTPRNVLEAASRYLISMYPRNNHTVATSHVPDILPLENHATLRYGKIRLESVLTPGHSPGHTCLYGRKEKVLFSGDHVLLDVTPNISVWQNLSNPLKSYFRSLDVVSDLDVDLILAGHGNPGTGLKQRVMDLKLHHNLRLSEILETLKDGPKNAYEVASVIPWSVKYKNWDSFPEIQKYFAVSETLAHLIYLRSIRAATIRKENGRVIYASTGSSYVT